MQQDVYLGFYDHKVLPLRYGKAKDGRMFYPLEIRRKFHGVDENLDIFMESESSNTENKPAMTYKSFQEEVIRRDYVFKVYLLLLAEFFVITCISCIYTSNQVLAIPDLHAIKFLYVLGVISVTIYLLMAFLKSLRKPPFSIILLGTLVTCLGFIIAIFVKRYQLRVINYTLIIECTILLFIVLLSKSAPCDVVGCPMIFCVIGTALLNFSIITSLVALMTESNIFHDLLCGIFLIVYNVFILFDVQIMMDFSKLREILPTDWLKGNLFLYLDIIWMVLYLIRLPFRIICFKYKVPIFQDDLIENNSELGAAFGFSTSRRDTVCL